MHVMINLTNISAWAVNDKVRMQVIDSKGNGEVWYVKPQSEIGITYVTKVVRAINPVCGKRMDKTFKSVVKT